MKYFKRDNDSGILPVLQKMWKSDFGITGNVKNGNFGSPKDNVISYPNTLSVNGICLKSSHQTYDMCSNLYETEIYESSVLNSSNISYISNYKKDYYNFYKRNTIPHNITHFQYFV